MLKLEGKVVALARSTALKQRIARFMLQNNRPPCLAVILVGDDPASEVYVKNKIKSCDELGIFSLNLKIPKNISERELIDTIQELNEKKDVDGILIQLPLPGHLHKEIILKNLNPMKDVDALTSENLGLLITGKTKITPCTPTGILAILEYFQIPVAGKNVVVIGRSEIVGKPMAQLLINQDATVTVCHSKTQNLKLHTQNADIVVVAAGRSQMFNKADFKKNAVVIDVGIHRTEKGLCGDVDPEGMSDWLSALTPVPGGVGPMTIHMLMENTVTLAELRAVK